MTATAASVMRATPAATGASYQAKHTSATRKTNQARPDVAVSHVPAVEVEIGEEEDEQRRRQHRLGDRARDPVGVATDLEEPVPEAEIDAHIGEHRPGQRRRGREDHGPAHHEDDGEEQRQQARDADDDALVEGQIGDLVLVGVGRPERQLGKVGGAQLRHVGDGRAGIERDAEDVGVGAVLALGREALARRDGRDARRRRGRARRARRRPGGNGAPRAGARSARRCRW